MQIAGHRRKLQQQRCTNKTLRERSSKMKILTLQHFYIF